MISEVVFGGPQPTVGATPKKSGLKGPKTPNFRRRRHRKF